MESAETTEPSQALHFAAVQITRPVVASMLRSSSLAQIQGLSLNHTTTKQTTKVTKLVLNVQPKPVQPKTNKIPVKNKKTLEPKQPPQKASVLESSQQALSHVNFNYHEIDCKNNKEEIPIRREEKNIDFEYVEAEKKKREEKILKQQQAQSSAITPKMDTTVRREARNFMRKQREQRKIKKNKEVDKTLIIKQRLEELRITTKSVLAKNPTKKTPQKASQCPTDVKHYSLDSHSIKEVKVLKLKPMNSKALMKDEEPSRQTYAFIESQKPILETSSKNSFSNKHKSELTSRKKQPPDEFKLNVPDVKLSINSHSIQQLHTPYIPFWMHSNSIQPYPYNFIWAVRKKLEAFATQYENEKQKQLRTDFELNTPQKKCEHKLIRGRKLTQITHHDDEANTISEISSIRSDVVKSLSHEILNEEHGDRTDRLSSQTERTKTNVVHTESMHEKEIFKKENAKTPSQHQVLQGNLNNLGIDDNKLSEEKEEEFRKMLVTFNKNLSHVVEVNHLLSSALVSKSQSSLSTQKEYSSSFEKNVETSNISEMIENLVNRRASVQETKSDSASHSAIETLIEESIENPPIVYQEVSQELTGSASQVTRTQIIHREEENEATINNSEVINIFELSGLENSFTADSLHKSTSNVKSWERSLIERTRGQIAWLELQKINFRKQGNTEKVSTVKKRQRAILLRLEKDRKKLKENMNKENLLTKSNSGDLLEKALTKLESSSLHNLPGNDSAERDNIERVLQHREQKIIGRRRKIEHLLSWQRRLEEEEKQLKIMEQELLDAYKIKSIRDSISSDNDIINKSFEMVKSINKSMKMLENIHISHKNEIVEVYGHKMNKLWYRLTGVIEERFHPQRSYSLTKRELSQFYEDAKETVLESDLKIFLENSQEMTVAAVQKSEIQSKSDNEQVPDSEVKESEIIKEHSNDTMESIANIETEEEYVGSDTAKINEERANSEDVELRLLLDNQMNVFVNDATFQVQKVSQTIENKPSSGFTNENRTYAKRNSNVENEMQEENQSNAGANELRSDSFTISDNILPSITDMDDDDDDSENYGQMIEDISFPQLEISFNDNRAHDLSTISECTEYEQVSSEPVSSDIGPRTNSTTTVSERLNSEIEQRLLSLSDSLEQVDEAFKRLPMMNANSSATYSTDKDFIDSNMIQEFEITKALSKTDSDIATSTPNHQNNSHCTD